MEDSIHIVHLVQNFMNVNIIEVSTNRRTGAYIFCFPLSAQMWFLFKDPSLV